jgi:multiple sugar transport system substrate-binding protein
MKLSKVAAAAALMSSALTATAQAAEPLKVWMRYGTNEAAVLDAFTKAFTEKTGIKLDIFLANTDFETRLARAAVGGSLPDVLLNDAPNMGQMNEMGILKPIDRAAIKGGDKVFDVSWESMRAADGKYYGVPFSAQAFAVFVRKDWREKLGMPVPKTWDDLYALAKAFTEKDPDGNGKKDTYGYVMPLSTTRGYATWFLADLIWQAGGDFMQQKNGGFVSTLATEPVAKAVGLARKMVCDGYAQPAAITSTTGDATPVFTSGQAGIYRSGPYHIAAFDKEPGKDKIEVIPAPAGPAGVAELAEGTAAFIMTGTKAEAEAKVFIEYLISKEGQEIGMGARSPNAQPIVRLSVNKDVDTAAVYNDPRWQTFATLFATNAHYFPQVPNWSPIRQMTSEGFNTILSDCKSDIMAGLKQMDKDVNAELAAQKALAKN